VVPNLFSVTVPSTEFCSAGVPLIYPLMSILPVGLWSPESSQVPPVDRQSTLGLGTSVIVLCSVCYQSPPCFHGLYEPTHYQCNIINRVVRALNADWLTAMVYQTIYHRYDKTFNFYCFNYVRNQFINSNKAPQGFVIYGQYTMATGCIQALRVASCVRTALSRGILAIYHTPSCLIA
jgi:hypothetical protein